MPTLTSTQLDTAHSYLGVDYAHSDIVGYYSYLASQGVTYGSLALGVIQNNTAEGQVANAYAATVAQQHGVDLSVDSSTWQAAMFNIATNDYNTRFANSGADLTWEDYRDIHGNAFHDANSALDVNTWSAYAPLSGLDSIDPGLANDEWNSIVAGTGSVVDVLGDGLRLAQVDGVMDFNQNPTDLANDIAIHIEWVKNVGLALVGVGDTIVNDLLPEVSYPTFWDSFGAFKDTIGDIFGESPPTEQPWINGFLDPDLDGAHAVAAPVCTAEDPFGSAFQAVSPLVIDLSAEHTGITLTEFSASTTTTFFDMHGTGFANQTAWVSGDTGLLAIDANSNGKIDSVDELFGSSTVDGFAKLAELDSNHDGKIDHTDADWSSLVVWTDTNGDAVTQDGELHSLDSLNIKSIDLAGVTASTDTIDGNPISHESTVTFTSGDTAAIDDAWFVGDAVNSFYNGDYAIDADTVFLPDLRGYGTIMDLAVAMSQDSTLKGLVTDFATGFSYDSFTDDASLNSSVADILYRWAGVDGVDAESRGGIVDAQHLEFLEHLFGQGYVQELNNSSNPLEAASALLENSWHQVLVDFKSDLMLQSGANALFENSVTYNPWTGAVAGDLSLSETAISDLATHAPSPGGDNINFWLSVTQFLDTVKGLGNFSGDENTWMDNAIQSTDSLLSWSIIEDTYHNINTGSESAPTTGDDTLSGTTGDDVIAALAGNDIVHGSDGNDILYGDDGNDTLYGGSGHDTLYGGDGNDTLYSGDDGSILYGGNGDDTIWGGAGNDEIHGEAGGNLLYGGPGDTTYVYGGGTDFISDSGGTDQIVLPSGVTAEDITLHYTPSVVSAYYGDLLIEIAGYGSIQIDNQFGIYSSSGHVEALVFNDTSTIDLTSLTGLDTLLTAGNDTFTAWDSEADYTVHGFAGNDTITTYGGNDTLDGGPGNDTFYGGGGNDTYIASPGFDTIHEGGGTDTIVVPDGFTMDDVSLERLASHPSDLVITIRGLGEIEVADQFYGVSYTTVENMHFLGDDSTVSLTDHAITILGGAGDDYLATPSINAPAGNIFDGREGNDNISGGTGDDTYIFSPGHDIVTEYGGNDTLVMPGDVAPEDVTVARVLYTYDAHYSLLVTNNNTGDTLLVDNHFYDNSSYDPGNPAPYAVEHIAFADSTTWDLLSMEIETHGTSGNDTLVGADTGDASNADTIYGYGGDDYLYGGDGNDSLYGGDGNDYLSGDAGNDTLDGGAGNDTLLGGDGNDLLYGGDGTDTLTGNAGADTFILKSATAFTANETITDFNTGQGDKIDISDILSGHYNPGTDVLSHFVEIDTSGSDSILKVDLDGTGGTYSMAAVATISGLTGLDVSTLVANSNLIVA